MTPKRQAMDVQHNLFWGIKLVMKCIGPHTLVPYSLAHGKFTKCKVPSKNNPLASQK